jgi:hypothetical protein
MRIFKWGEKKEDTDLLMVESVLEGVFQPVQPRPEFKRKLHAQVLRQFQPIQEETRIVRQRRIWMIVASLVGGLLTIFMGVRFVMTLIAMIGLLLQFKKDSQTKPAMALRLIR